LSEEHAAPLASALTSEERRVLAVIEEGAERLPPALSKASFLAHLPRARAGIAHRLVQALVREGLVSAAGSSPDQLIIPLSGGGRLIAAVTRRLSLGRFDLRGPLVFIGPDGHEEIVDEPADLLDRLRSELRLDEAPSRERIERFKLELRDSSANYALALVAEDQRRLELAQDGSPRAASSLDLARELMRADPLFDPLVFFEQSVVDGHPLHPGAKIKMGLSPDEVIRYSPEWGARPELRLVAIRKEVCFVSGDAERTPTEWLRADHPRQVEEAHRFLSDTGRPWQAFEVLPVHPWQFEKTLPELYEEPIRRGEIVPVPGPAIKTAALMSFRSVAPISARGQFPYHFKTAVNVQTTGAVRIITPQAIRNGPALTRVLEEIAHRERDFGGLLKILGEPLGVSYAASDPVLAKNLAVLFRENPARYVGPGEIPMPGAAMLARSPVGSLPIATELVTAFAERRGIRDLQAASIAFMKRYAEVCLPGFLTLMTRYGVSLEGHLQNSVPVFDGGALVRVLVRDLGGVRVLRERLIPRGLDMEFSPGSATVTTEVRELRNKILYPLFQNHLGELIATLVRAIGLEERLLWEPVAREVRRIYGELASDPAIAAQAREDEAAIFAPAIDLKAMTAMRLCGEVTRYTFAEVESPLFEAEVLY
jgi:siderophore synthetase component